MKASTDAELVELARSGNKDAFGVLVERYRPMAYRVATSMVRHPDTAQELAQEAVLQAYLSLDRLRDAPRFQSWLYGIVLNVCRGYIRQQGADLLSLEVLSGGFRRDDPVFVGEDADPQDAVETMELHRVVLEALDELSPKNRAATLLFYYEQLSTREIAAVLGISATAVKGRLHKARGQLRKLLLPLHTEVSQRNSQETEVRRMLQVDVADVFTRERENKETGRPMLMSVVLLIDQERRRWLRIWMGPFEGQSIALGHAEMEIPRPLTFSFLASILEAAQARLEEVRIEQLKDDTYYAVAKLRIGDEVREVDARPSDAMALAVHAGAPIYAAGELMEKAGYDVPGGIDRLRPLDDELDVVVRESLAEAKSDKPRADAVTYAKEDFGSLFRSEAVARWLGPSPTA